jgi:hypothetical protein
LKRAPFERKLESRRESRYQNVRRATRKQAPRDANELS